MKSALQVFEVRDSGDGSYSTPSVDVPNDSPVSEIISRPGIPVVAGLIGLGESGHPELTWVPVTGATGYRIESQVGTLWTNIASLTGQTVAIFASDLLLSGNFYRVKAFNTAGNGLPSNAVSFTAP